MHHNYPCDHDLRRVGIRQFVQKQLREWIGYTGVPRESWGMFGIDPEAPGTSVTHTALQTQITWTTCVELKARDVAKLPVILYGEDEHGARERAKDDPRYWLLKSKPNPEMTHMAWMMAMMGNLWLWGNAYAFIERTKMSKQPAALWPLHPQEMALKRIDGKLYYQWHPPGGKPQTWPASEVIHLKRFTLDGITGISPLGAIRLTVGQQLKADEYSHKFYDNAAMLSGVVSADGELSDQGYDRMQSSFKKFHQGVKNAFSLLILEAGTKFAPLSIPQKDAQFLESNRFRGEQLSAFAGLPVHRLNDMSRATYSNVQQNSLSYMQESLLFETTNITEELDAKLIGQGENLYYEFLFDSILQADSATKYEALQKQFYMGTPLNRLLKLDNQPPVEGGDEPLVPVNMIPLSTLLKPKAPEPVPDPAPADPAPQDEARAVKHRRSASLRARLRVAVSGADAIGDAIARVVRKEVAGLKPIVAAYDGTEQVQTVLESYYTDEIIDRIRRDVTKVFSSVAKGVYAEVSEEMNREFLASEISNFVEQYAQGYARAHAAESVKQLSALARDNWAPDDLRSALQQRLSEWLERRADKEAERQSVQLANKAAREGYRSAGVRTLVWRSNANCCPICSEMDGRVCGIESSFLEHDDEIRAEDGETAPFRARGDVFTPPLHGGCACSIEPGS